MASIDLTWVIGGPQGGGVETAANIFAGACAGCGLRIFGKREYYSNTVLKGLLASPPVNTDEQE